MAQIRGIVKGDAFQKIGSAGFIISAILVVVSGLLMPHAANLNSSLQEMLKPLGEHEFRTYFSSLLMTIGFWAAMIGAAGVYRSIAASGTAANGAAASGAAWARLGFYFTLIGTALWTVCLSLDVGTASAVANWLAAPAVGKEAAWSVVAALSAFGRGIIPLTWIIYWLALAFLGTAMIHNDVYPRWLGWAGLLVSLPVIVLGVVQVFTSRSITLTLIFSILVLLTALWNLATGIWVARKAW